MKQKIEQENILGLNTRSSMDRNELYKLYTSFATTELLKKVGFNGHMDVVSLQHITYHAPLLAIAQDWIRTEKKYEVIVEYNPTIKEEPYVVFIYNLTTGKFIDSYGYFKQYNDALDVGIKKTLEFLLKK